MREGLRAVGWGITFVLFMAGGFITPWLWVASIAWFVCFAGFNEWLSTRPVKELEPEPVKPKTTAEIAAELRAARR